MSYVSRVLRVPWHSKSAKVARGETQRGAAKSWDCDEDSACLTGQVVLENEDGWTGLYDAQGNELWRVREIGFRLRED